MLPGPRYRGLTTTRTLVAPLTGNKKREQRIFGTPGKAYTSLVPVKISLYPVWQKTFSFYTKCDARRAAVQVKEGRPSLGPLC